MNELDIIKLRGRILDDLANLEKTAATARATVEQSSEEIPNFLQDESGAAKGGVDLENALSVHQHCVTQQKLLRSAIRRMDLGDFGICHDCGCQIDSRRLEAMPGATCCVDCQSEQEKITQPQVSRKKSLGSFRTGGWHECHS